MPHPLSSNLTTSDLYTASFANDALVLNLLIAATSALPVLNWTENPLTEQTVPLWLERTIVDRLRLLDFAVRPP